MRRRRRRRLAPPPPPAESTDICRVNEEAGCLAFGFGVLGATFIRDPCEEKMSLVQMASMSAPMYS